MSCSPAACHWTPGRRKWSKDVNTEFSGVNKAIESPHATPPHHSNWVVTPCCGQAELLDVHVLLHGFGKVLQRGNWNVLENQQRHTAMGPEIDTGTYTLWKFVFLCTLMLLRLTSVKELSLLFILCRVSSTLVGLGGSSNTGFIFSPLITSRKHTQAEVEILLSLETLN